MPSDIRFADLQRLLEHHGWTLQRIKGSHHHFRGAGRDPLSIPVHKGKVRWCYQREVERAIAAYLARESRPPSS